MQHNIEADVDLPGSSSKQQEKLFIEDIDMDTQAIRISKLSEISRNSSLIVCHSVNICYVFFFLVVVGRFYSNGQSHHVVSIVLSGVYSLVCYFTLSRQNKRIKAFLPSLQELHPFKCASLVVDLTDLPFSRISVKELLISSIQFQNWWLFYLLPIAIYCYYFISQLLSTFNVQEAIAVFGVIFLPLHFSTLFFALIALNSLFKYNPIPSHRHSNARISESPVGEETGVISAIAAPQNQNKLNNTHNNTTTPSRITVSLSSDCCICLQQLNMQKCITTYFCCNNSFHTECITAWLDANIRCPLCRAEIS